MVSNYETKKQLLLEQFDLARAQNTPFSLQKKTSNLFRHRNQKQSAKLDVRSFNQVLSIDTKNGIVDTEAMITYEDLVRETMKDSLIPPVVPELKTITIGGAFVGLGIEASSFRYGLVHETVIEIEVLTGDGRILICRPDNKYRDLFLSFANSYGTLGYILRLKAKLIPTKPFIHLSHQRFSETKTFFNALKELCAKKTDDFIEGTIFNRNEMILSTGNFRDKVANVSNYKYMNIYYQSIRIKKEDNLLTADFIWRWDTDWFWCSKHFGMQYRILRFLFGKLMLKSKFYWKIKYLSHANPIFRFFVNLFSKKTESVVQDILIPVDRAEEFLQFLFESIGITPIWACPYQALDSKNPFLLLPTDPSILYIDFGFWDMIPTNQPKGHYNRLIERKTKELNGFKSLYSESYYTEEEFWTNYPKSDYFKLKNSYDKDNILKSLYYKCSSRTN